MKTAEQVLDEITGTDSGDTIEPNDVDEALSNSGDDSGGGDAGTSGDESQDSDGADEKVRSFAELNERASDSNFKMNESERKRVQLAVTRGLTSDEQIDDILNKGKDSSDSEEKSEKSEEDEEDNKSESDDDNNKNEDNNEADPDDSGESIDSQLLKVIGPHLDKAESVEDAVTAVKNLQHHAQQSSEFKNKFVSMGLDTPEKGEQALKTLSNIDTDIQNRLQSPEGLKSLYGAYNIPVPSWMGNVASSDATKFNGAVPNTNSNDNNALPAELGQMLGDIDNDGYIGAQQLKDMIPSLVSHIQGNLEKKYEAQGANMKKVGDYVAGLAKTTQRTQEIDKAFQDAREISDQIGRYDENVKLKDDPKTIWKESISETGKVKKETHPEFKKLQKIFGVRKGAMTQINAYNTKLGIKNGPVDVIGHLSKVLVSSGSLQNILNKNGKDLKQNLMGQLASKLQPNIRDKKIPKHDVGFKVPKSQKDVSNMTRSQRKVFLEKLRKGSLVVGA